MKEIVKTYKKKFKYSYTSGAYATIELLNTRPELVKTVFIHSQYYEPEKIVQLCNKRRVKVEKDDAVFRYMDQKENSYVLGVFEKYASNLNPDAPHVVLVNPSDMGNLGTIVRTLVGFGMPNLSIITPCADIFHPKTVRASMGSLFRVNFQHFDRFEEYMNLFPHNKLFTFMPEAEYELISIVKPPIEPFSLVFGNEATGLGECFRKIGTAIKIPQTKMVDSLNLSIAVAIGVYAFLKR